MGAARVNSGACVTDNHHSPEDDLSQTLDALGLPFALWTRHVVQALIAQKTKVRRGNPLEGAGRDAQDEQARLCSTRANARGARTGEAAPIEPHFQYYEPGTDAL